MSNPRTPPEGALTPSPGAGTPRRDISETSKGSSQNSQQQQQQQIKSSLKGTNKSESKNQNPNIKSKESLVILDTCVEIQNIESNQKDLRISTSTNPVGNEKSQNHSNITDSKTSTGALAQSRIFSNDKSENINNPKNLKRQTTVTHGRLTQTPNALKSGMLKQMAKTINLNAATAAKASDVALEKAGDDEIKKQILERQLLIETTWWRKFRRKVKHCGQLSEEDFFTELADEKAKFAEVWTAIFRFIDESGDLLLQYDELEEWFKGTNLVNIMSFDEFLSPIVAINDPNSDECDCIVFCEALEFIRAQTLYTICMNSLSFWLALIFIQAGIVYLGYEVALGENLLTTDDMEFRIMQLWAWTGFLLGFIGYFRVFIQTLAQQAMANRILMETFNDIMVPQGDESVKQRESSNAEVQALGDDNVGSGQSGQEEVQDEEEKQSQKKDIDSDASDSKGNRNSKDETHEGNYPLSNIVNMITPRRRAVTGGVTHVTDAVNQVTDKAVNFTDKAVSLIQTSPQAMTNLVGGTGPHTHYQSQNHPTSSLSLRNKAEMIKEVRTQGSKILADSSAITDDDKNNEEKDPADDAAQKAQLSFAERLRSQFHMMDLDGSGTISRYEMREWWEIGQMNKVLPFERFWALFQIEELEEGNGEDEKEVDMEMFLEALVRLYSKSSNTWELAKQKPGFWLMCAGLLQGIIRVVDSAYYVDAGHSIDKSLWLLVFASFLKLLGDAGILLVYVQIIYAEVDTLAKVREIMVQAMLEADFESEPGDRQTKNVLSDTEGPESQSGKESDVKESDVKDSVQEENKLLQNLDNIKSRESIGTEISRTGSEDGPDIEGSHNRIYSQTCSGSESENTNVIDKGQQDQIQQTVTVIEGQHFKSTFSTSESDVDIDGIKLNIGSEKYQGVDTQNAQNPTKSQSSTSSTTQQKSDDAVNIYIKKSEQYSVSVIKNPKNQTKKSWSCKLNSITSSNQYNRNSGSSQYYGPGTVFKLSKVNSIELTVFQNLSNVNFQNLNTNNSLDQDSSEQYYFEGHHFTELGAAMEQKSKSENAVKKMETYNRKHGHTLSYGMPGAGGASSVESSIKLGDEIGLLYDQSGNPKRSSVTNAAARTFKSMGSKVFLTKTASEKETTDLELKSRQLDKMSKYANKHGRSQTTIDPELFNDNSDEFANAHVSGTGQSLSATNVLNLNSNAPSIIGLQQQLGSPASSPVTDEETTKHLVLLTAQERADKREKMAQEENIKGKKLAAINQKKKLSDMAEKIFHQIDKDQGGSVDKNEILDFMEEMGLNRVEMSGQIEKTFAKYDVDGSGELDIEEFVELLEDLDSPETISLKSTLKNDVIFWASCLVVVASAFSIMSATLMAIYGGKDTQKSGISSDMWKVMDYPKAAFLCIRGFVMFMHEFRFFKADAYRYYHIYSALVKTGEQKLAEQNPGPKSLEQKLAEQGRRTSLQARRSVGFSGGPGTSSSPLSAELKKKNPISATNEYRRYSVDSKTSQQTDVSAYDC